MVRLFACSRVFAVIGPKYFYKWQERFGRKFTGCVNDQVVCSNPQPSFGAAKINRAGSQWGTFSVVAGSVRLGVSPDKVADLGLQPEFTSLIDEQQSGITRIQIAVLEFNHLFARSAVVEQWFKDFKLKVKEVVKQRVDGLSIFTGVTYVDTFVASGRNCVSRFLFVYSTQLSGSTSGSSFRLVINSF